MQRLPKGFPWEVLVIDNASTDTTSAVAYSAWPADTPLRVICEPRLGLNYARARAFLEAKYELVSFIDDDNWVCPDWVELVWQILSEHPEVGACGGNGQPELGADPPSWFERHAHQYATGPQAPESGYVSRDRSYLYGAGLTVRKSAWDSLVRSGFRSALIGRRGQRLTSGEETELCHALVLLGWKLWYDSRLQFRHYIPAGRLTWRYLRRLHRGFGSSDVYLKIYTSLIWGEASSLRQRFRASWIGQMQTAVRNLWQKRRTLVRMRHASFEGVEEVLQTEELIGRIFSLIRILPTYHRKRKFVSKLLWRQAPDAAKSIAQQQRA